MPSKKQYDLVSDDGYDSRIPLHNEDAFQHGIHFNAKYIGTLDVPRPSSRVEIVAAMRRIRYEFKAKAIKKKKVDITVSIDGVKIVMRRAKPKVPLPFVSKYKDDWAWDDNRLLVMQHPIYRIFYVSHDSQDLKIFSYIARDGSSNVFKCNVFKAQKKSEAMRVVRTVGQAFEVCHKMSINTASQQDPAADKPGTHVDSDDGMPKPSIASTEGGLSETTSLEASTKASTVALPQSPQDAAFQEAQTMLEQAVGTISSPTSPSMLDPQTAYVINTEGEALPITARHRIEYLRQHLEQQQQHTQVALAHVTLLKEQLAAETTARIQAQARAHNLLVQNRELLEHINALVRQLQELEARLTGADADQLHLLSTPIQHAPMPEVTSPEPGPTFIPAVTELDLSTISAVQNSATLENTHLIANLQNGNANSSDDVSFRFSGQVESPDSGHREMSSDSLVSNVIPNDVSIQHAQQNSGLYTSGSLAHPGGNYVNYSGHGNGQVIATNHQFNPGYQRSINESVNSNPFLTNSRNNNMDQSNNYVNGFSEPEKADQENNNNINSSIRSSQTMTVSGTTSSKLVQKMEESKPNSGISSERSMTRDAFVLNKNLENEKRMGADSAVFLDENPKSSPQPKSTSAFPNKSTSALPSNNPSAISENSTSAFPNKSASALMTSADPSSKKSPQEVEKAKKEGVLKTLNLNLKSLGSSHKRHSSTSAELYRRSDSTDSDTAAKAAIQSASESKLLLRNKDKKENDKKSSVFAISATKS